MENRGAKPEAAHYNALVTVLSHAREPERGERYFEAMTAEGMKPERGVWVALIESYAAANRPKKAEVMRVQFLVLNRLVLKIWD